MERQEAVKQVSEKVLLLAGEQKPNSDTLAFYIEKLVADILDYCHRDDFPDALVYTVVELVQKRLADAASAAATPAQTEVFPVPPLPDRTAINSPTHRLLPQRCFRHIIMEYRTKCKSKSSIFQSFFIRITKQPMPDSTITARFPQIFRL